MKKAYFNWSSGKDSALALYKILQQEEFEVKKLITNINTDYKRVSMHGLREELLDAQAKSIGITLEKIAFSATETMETYNKKMFEKTSKLKREGFQYAIFGDILLEDLRIYRDTKLATVKITGVYPLWKQNTKDLLLEFLDLGFKTITVCTNAKFLGKEFVGRIVDRDFIKDLPKNVDVCGENGEFHTFCFDGPIFKNPIKFEVGKKLLRTLANNSNNNQNCYSNNASTNSYDTRFWYCDLKII